MTDSAAPSGGTPPEHTDRTPKLSEPKSPSPYGSSGSADGLAHPEKDLRASDADRERVAEHLREALAEGRLDMEEFGERLDATYQARTYGELAPITRDLPVPGVAAPPVPHRVNMVKEPLPGHGWEGRIVGGEGRPHWGVAVMSGFERKGRWLAPRRFNAVSIMGGGVLDLREAVFEGPEIEINVVTVMGGLNVIVPPGVEVVNRGFGFMGGFDVPGEERGDPGAPRVVITGFAFMGGVAVERKLTRAERYRLKEQRRQDRLDRQQRRREDRLERRSNRRLEPGRWDDHR